MRRVAVVSADERIDVSRRVPLDRGQQGEDQKRGGLRHVRALHDGPGALFPGRGLEQTIIAGV
jgi:hypothetical protein